MIGLAKAIMRRFESVPDDPTTTASGMNEIFRHESFTKGSAAERERIMHASSSHVYEDELRYPWDNYFGRDLASELRGLRVLDLGCFTGGRAVAWAERYGLAHISGLDTSPVFIDAARSFAAAKNVAASFAVGVGEELPYPAAAFDAILSFDVFEHVRDPSRVLAECYRVLAPRGRAYFVFPSFFQPTEHHLGLVTTAPFIHYFFRPRTLVAAYADLLEERGDEASWYEREPRELQPWERGHTINGLTVRRFRRLARGAGFTIQDQVRLPLGSVGRRSQGSTLMRAVAGAMKPFARLPVVEEAVLHRATFVLRKS